MTERSPAAEIVTPARAPVEVPPAAAAPPDVSTPPNLAPAATGAAPALPLAPPPLPGVVNAVPPMSPAEAAAIDASAEPSELHENWWLHVPSWLASMVVHLLLVLCLALLTIAQQTGGGMHELIASLDDKNAPGNVEELENQLMQSADKIDEPQVVPAPDMTDSSKIASLAGPIGLVRPEAVKGDTELKPFGGEEGAEAGLGGNPLELRLDGAARAKLLEEGGGTRQSEEAVKKALHWLSEHQNYDGSWTFEHQKSPRCHGACNDPGFTPGKIAATALALLPFLGNGQTQHDGPYKRNIDLGLRFLVRTMQIQGDLGSLHEQGGQMYGHGLASIVLCEAYGMTHDQFLAVPAQACVNFIVEAQDPVGGGWRYVPRQVGDTSVVGWQLMALKSAQMAYLRVPQNTMRKAGYFLDHVQSDRGAVYGYQTPERGRPATTAIGLLCRMYLGWKHDQQGLQRGVQLLSALGPSTDSSRLKNNMYYNYYATQVLHHYGGSEWRRWNEVLREYLIASQATKGHETGSWFLDGADHGAPAGGRLYCTAMTAMTLEVYYRYMPLYRPQSTTEFPGQQ